MRRTRTWALLALVPLLMTPANTVAQEFRVYTKIYHDTANGEAARRVAARTLSLFHAGKVYDFVETVDEVIIFEPMQNRFTILNTKRALATVVHFDEIKRLMSTVRTAAKKRLRILSNRNDQQSKMTAEKLRFQLDPQFKTTYKPREKRLILSSPHLRYEVKLVRVQTQEISDAFRRYADWISRLNFVMSPRLLLPGPRLALNRRVQEKGMIPQQVVLEAQLRSRIRLRAEHQIHWALDRNDRTRLNAWKMLLQDRNTRHVTFQQYQREISVSLSKKQH